MSIVSRILIPFVLIIIYVIAIWHISYSNLFKEWLFSTINQVENVDIDLYSHLLTTTVVIEDNLTREVYFFKWFKLTGYKQYCDEGYVVEYCYDLDNIPTIYHEGIQGYKDILLNHV